MSEIKEKEKEFDFIVPDDAVHEEVQTEQEWSLLTLFEEFKEKGFSKAEAMLLAKDEAKRRKKKEKESAEAEKEYEKEVTKEMNLATLAGDEDDPDDGGDKSWVDHIGLNKDNTPKYIYGNTYNLIHYHPKFAGKFEKNMFTYNYEFDRRVVDDEMMKHIRHFVNTRLFNVKSEWVEDAIAVESCKKQYHPVKEVIDELVWDGTPRVEEFFIYRLGAADTPLTRELTAKWMFAMLMRLYEPGCYFDHYLIICDRQGGTGKTKTFEKLTECLHANVEFPLTPIITDITNEQNNVLMLQRTLVGLFDESSGMKYANLERFKSFITTNKFTARLPYKSKPEVLHTHSVFALNTNDEAFLTDNTTMYERRAWVLPCHGVRDAGEDYWGPRNNDDTLRQVWAELLHWYKHPETAPYDMTGNKFNFISKSSEQALIAVQQTKKTSTLDVDLYNTVSSIFSNTYSKNMFFNERDFLSDFRHSKRGKDEEDYDVQLDVIPCDWVVSVAQKSVIGKRSTDCVRNMVNKVIDDGVIGKWQLVDKCKYADKTMPCWVKVKVGSTDDAEPQKSLDIWKDQNNLPK